MQERLDTRIRYIGESNEREKVSVQEEFVMNKTIIRIAFAADHAYAPYMEVGIVSILKSNKGEEIVFEILDVGLNENDIKSIEKSITNYDGAKFRIYNLRNIERLLGVNVPAFLGSFGAYGRLFLPNLLKDCDKVLYLDCDTLTVADLCDLWNSDMTGYYIAGVKDTISKVYRRKIGLGGLCK